MTNPRDNQRKRLYDAERAATLTPSTTARRLLIDTARVPSTGSVTIEACQNYVDHLTQSAWFQRRWDRKRYTVRHKAYGDATYTGGWTSYISVPPWARDEWVLLHEVTHGLVTSSNCAHHGPEFAGVFLTLVEHRMGKAAGASLREAYKAKRVRYNMVKVPKPTKALRPVANPVKVPTAAVAARWAKVNAEREAAEVAREARRVTPGYNFTAADEPEGGFMFWFGSLTGVASYAAQQCAGRLRPQDRPMSVRGVETTKRGTKVEVTWTATMLEPLYWRVEIHAEGKVRHVAGVVLGKSVAVA